MGMGIYYLWLKIKIIYQRISNIIKDINWQAHCIYYLNIKNDIVLKLI